MHVHTYTLFSLYALSTRLQSFTSCSVVLCGAGALWCSVVLCGPFLITLESVSVYLGEHVDNDSALTLLVVHYTFSSPLAYRILIRLFTH
jgi:hypothetical protein